MGRPQLQTIAEGNGHSYMGVGWVAEQIRNAEYKGFKVKYHAGEN
jgi:hypothetical protein